MRIRLLGPVGLVAEGRTIPLAGGRLQALLAVLALHTGQALNKDQLIHELWPENMPGHPANALQALITRLRRHLRLHLDGPPKQHLVTTRSGYELKVSPALVDARVFTDSYAVARKVLPQNPAQAREILGTVLPLWQGPPLHGVNGGPLCRSAALELEELRLSAIEADVLAGVMLSDPRVVSELKRLVSLYPWRERFTELLMVALYRSGRQVEAMEIYHQARTRLVRELGLEPSPQLRDRAQAILNHEPDLLTVGGE